MFPPTAAAFLVWPDGCSKCSVWEYMGGELKERRIRESALVRDGWFFRRHLGFSVRSEKVPFLKIEDCAHYEQVCLNFLRWWVKHLPSPVGEEA